jgi:adenylate cyclase class IV
VQHCANVLETAAALREIIETADFEEMRYILHRLGFSALVVESKQRR